MVYLQLNIKPSGILAIRKMPATRSATRSTTSATASAAVAGHYNLRSNRPSAGFFAGMDDEPELTAADHAAAATLVAMRSAPMPAVATSAAMPQRRSARIAARS